MNEIKYSANHIVFWPGQEEPVCNEHKNQLYKLNAVMGGSPLFSRRLLASEYKECSNCINEEKDNG